MYTLTAWLSIGCFVGVGSAVDHRLWWAIPLLVMGGVFFFMFDGGDEYD